MSIKLSIEAFQCEGLLQSLSKCTVKLYLRYNSATLNRFADITLANDAGKTLTITPKKPRCCWRVDKNDLDCKVGIDRILIGLIGFSCRHKFSRIIFVHVRLILLCFFAVNGTNWWK